MKRAAEPSPTDEIPSTRARLSEPEDEALSVQTATEILSVQDCQQLLQVWDQTKDIEVLISAYMQKKSSKEVPAVGNEPVAQQMVEESKLVEWTTLTEKGAIKIHTGKRAAWLKAKHPDRFMGSRFVIV